MRLVDDEGRPYLADEIEIGALLHGTARGQEWEGPGAFGAGLLVVRLPAEFIHLPAARRDWAPARDPRLLEDLPPRRLRDLAVPVSDLRADAAQQPALHLPVPLLDVPPGEGGRVLFGPAGRALPQLPLMIDARATCGPPAGSTRTSARRGGACTGPSVNAVERDVHRRFERASRSAEQRLGLAAGVKWAMRYVFPDHWSFLLGEIALYSFMVLVGTGIFLTLYYVPSDSQVIYHGSYRAAAGRADVGGLPLGARTSASTCPPGCCSARSTTGPPTCSSPRSCCT